MFIIFKKHRPTILGEQSQFWNRISDFRSMELVFERYGSDMEERIRLWSLDQRILG